MKCPVCISVNLVMSERQGIEIDYCPECRGVWLDRDELDKIIARAVPQPAQAPQQYRSANGHAPGYGQGYSPGHKPYKKKSFLEELFD
jgi:Zn-finger nucleic acid-binding protein